MARRLLRIPQDTYSHVTARLVADAGREGVGMSRYYHRTEAASAIMREGFMDATGSYGFASTILSGVFIADVIADISDGARGEDVIELEIPDDVELGPFEIIEELKGFREWCVPAALLNAANVSLRLLTQDEVDEIEWEKIRRFM